MAVAAAELGFKVETSGLVKGKEALDHITNAAGKTETKVTSLAKVMSSVGKTFAGAALGMTRSMESLVAAMNPYNISQRAAATDARKFAESIYEAAKAEDALTSSFQRATKAVEKQNREFKKSAQTSETKGTSRFYTGNIVSQFQDVAVTAAMGMNPLTIALQQGTQLSAVLDSMEKPLEGILSGFKALVGPTTLITLGLTALTAVGLQTIDWANAGQTALNSFANALDFAADHATALAGALGLLSLSALPSLLTATASGFTAFGTALLGVSKAAFAFVGSKLLMFLYGLTSPLSVVTLAVLAASEAFNQWVVGMSAFEATVKSVKTAINTLIGSVAAASAAVTSFYNFLFRQGKSTDVNRSIKDALNADYVEQFASKLRGAANAMRNYGKATDQVKNPWENINKYFEKTLASIELETKLIGKEALEVERLRYEYELFNRAKEAGLNTAQQEVFSQLNSQVSALTKAKELFLTRQESKTYSDFVESTRQSVESLKAMKQQLFMTSEELYKLKAFEDLINQAQSKGVKLTYNRLNSFNETAKGIAKEKAEYDSLTATISTANNLTSSFFIDMKNGLAQGENAWKAFGSAVTNVLNNIANALIQFATNRMVLSIASSFMNMGAGAASSANNPFSGSSEALTGTLSIGQSSSAGTLSIGQSSGMSALHPSAKGNVFTNSVVDNPTIFKFAKGSRFGVMGEAGPEAVMPLTRSSDGSLGVRALGEKSEGTVIVNVINNSNASARTEERQTSNGKEIDVIIDQMVSRKINEQGSSTNRALGAYSSQKLISR